MQNKRFLKLLSCLLCIVLIAATALIATGCKDDKSNNSAPTAAVNDENIPSENIKGEGQTKFFFSVKDLSGKETVFEIHTDKKTVGEALLELNLIAGDSSEYGLYVKTVNGITVDYDKDGKYWAFYIGGEYAMSGVDTTEISAGATYSFVAE